MNTEEILKTVTTTRLSVGYAYTGGAVASIHITEVDEDKSIRIDIDDMWFYASDLREAASLFNQLAEVLEQQ